MENRKIDFSRMPPTVMRNLCRTFAEETEKYFRSIENNPEEMKKFEEWERQKEEVIANAK